LQVTVQMSDPPAIGPGATHHGEQARNGIRIPYGLWFAAEGAVLALA